MKSVIGLIALMIIALLVTSCAPSRSGQVYSRDQARRAHTVETGTAEQIREVMIEGTPSGVGAVAGAAAGAAAEEQITKADGLEILVRLDSGRLFAVVQESDVWFSAGDRV